MDANEKTSLSVGEELRAALLEDPAITAITSKVYPVATFDANLPYIVYRRATLSPEPVKSGRLSDTTTMELACYSEGYDEGLRLAEAVRGCLDGKFYNGENLRLSLMRLEDAVETWEDDAYVQSLIFTIKIN